MSQMENPDPSATTASTQPVAITVDCDGPLSVEGAVRIVGADGELIEATERTWLCRCGHSANKPFCDGSHRKAGFSDPGVPATH